MGAENSNQTDKPRFVGSQVKLEKLCAKGKSSLRQKDLLNDGPYPVYGASGVIGTISTFQNDAPYVCVVKDGAGVGRAMKCRAHSSVLGTMQALIPNKGINCDYLLHLVRSLKLGEGFTGSTIPHIYFRDYGKRLVPVFPYEQQIAIASMLNGIEALVDQRKLMLRKYDSLVKSRFIEMFGDIDDTIYEVKRIQDCCERIKDGTHQTPSYVEEGDNSYLFLSSKNVVRRAIDWSTAKYIPEALHRELHSRVSPRKGDILLAKNGTTGICAIVDRDCVFDIYVSLALIRPLGFMDSTYFWAAINADRTKRQFDSRLKGVGVPNLHLGEIRETLIVVPPLNLQKQFAAFAAQVDKLRFAGNHEMNFRCERFTLS